MTEERLALDEAIRGLRALSVGMFGGSYATTTKLRLMAQTTLSNVEDTLGLPLTYPGVKPHHHPKSVA